MDLAEKMADEIERELKVLPFKPRGTSVEVEKVADVHRNAIFRYEQRIADAQRDAKARIAMLEADIQAEKDRHADELDRLSSAILNVENDSKADVEASRKLADASRAALECLR